MAHARRSPQHREPSSSINSPSATRKNTLRRSTSRASSHASTQFIPSSSLHTLRPVLVPLQPNLRRLPSRINLSHKVDQLDKLMRDPGHVIAGSKRKRAASSNENAHTHGRPTRGSGRLKRLRTANSTVSRHQHASTSEESLSEASDMEVDSPGDAQDEDTEGSDNADSHQGVSDDEEHHNSSDDFLLQSASPKTLYRLLKHRLVELYDLCGLTGDAELFTKQELVDAIINSRDSCASVPPSSPVGKGDGASSEYSSDDGHFAGDEETDAGGSLLPSHGSPLKRRVTTHDFGAVSIRPLKSRSFSLGNISDNNETSKYLPSKRKASIQLESNQLEPTASRKGSARSSPITSAATSSLKSSPPATRLRSRNASTSVNSSLPEPTSRGKGKAKAKQVEFSNEVEVHEQLPLKTGSKGKDAQVYADSESDLTELEDECEEPIGMPSPRRLRSKDRQTESSKEKRKENNEAFPAVPSKQRKRIRSADSTAETVESSTSRSLRVTPMRKAKGKVGNLKEPDTEDYTEEEGNGEEGEETQEEDGTEHGLLEDVENGEAYEEEEVDELISSASITPPPEHHGRRTPLRKRLRPRRTRNKMKPTVDEENEGDDEDEEEAEEEGEEVNEEGQAEEDGGEEDEGILDDEGDDDEVTIAVEPRKLRNGKIVGEEDAEMDVDEESVADEDGDGEDENADDVSSVDVDAEGETDGDEAMKDDVDLTVATARTLVRLRRDDLVRLCQSRDLDPSGTKPQLAEALLQWRDRQGNDFSSPSSGGTIRPTSKKKRRTKHHSDSTDTTVPVLLRSGHNHTDEPRTPVPGKDKDGKDKDGKDKDNEELELDLESLGLEDREIPPEKLTKLEKIGSGGFKDVYIGKFKNRKIAISEFRGQLSNMDIKELKLLGAFNHPNIVRFLGVSIPENTKDIPVMIVSELCSNGDLFDYIRNTNAPSLRKLLLMMCDIARGLEYLHTRKPSIIHRDCKSSNILITAKGTAKIADFGLAKVKQSTRSMVRSLVGTVNWQAPELWTAHPKYNHKVDTFSCAMVYWEMLQWHAQTKKYPWEGMNEHAIYEIVGTKRQRPSIANLRKQWCPEIVDLMEKMWAQEHQDRPNMTEVVKVLEDLLTMY